MLPSDIGLPPKFTAYRAEVGQESLIFDLAGSAKRTSLVVAPTGSGKSLIYVSVAKLLCIRTLILVSNKALQSQLSGEFSSCGLFDIRGHSNYPCASAVYGDDDQLEHFGCSAVDGSCGYRDVDIPAACSSDIVLTNYHHWIHLRKTGDPGRLGTFGMIVCDEAHLAHDILVDQVAIKLSRSTISRYLLGATLPSMEALGLGDDNVRGKPVAVPLSQALSDHQSKQGKGKSNSVDPITSTEAVRNLVEWSSATLDQATTRHTQMKRTGADKRDLLRLSNLISNLSSIASIQPTEYFRHVIDRTDTGIRVMPVYGSKHAEPYLFRGCPRIILTSATLNRQKTINELGISNEDHDYYEVKSAFAARRRPMIYIPTARVDFRSKQSEGIMRMLVNNIDHVIYTRTVNTEFNRPGIIHAISYDWARSILARTRYRELIISHGPGETRSAVERFAESSRLANIGEGRAHVLLTPAAEEGFDFADWLARWQIIWKVPFIDGRNPVVRARSDINSSYKTYLTSDRLVQMYGRLVRSLTDWGETFIFDDHWKYFRSQGSFAGWFRDACVEYDSVPEPLEVAA